VFRDQTSLSASPELWSAIEEALSKARFFVLLASPEAAASHWVDQEVRWWRENRGHDTVLIVLTDGELVWDDERGDFDPTSAIPPGLRGFFPREPLWADLRWARGQRDLSMRNPRFRDSVAELAAPIRGIPKDELIGEDISQHRRTLRLARGAVSLLVLLLALAVVGGIVALDQRNTARSEARTSLSRQLAATADNLQSSDLETALLLAVQAYETEASSDTYGALIRADMASPSLARFVHFGDRVSSLATSPDGNFAAIGLTDGSVLRVSLTASDPAPKTVLTLDKKVSSLSISDNATAVAASDGTQAVLWRSDAIDAIDLAVPAGQDAGAVGLSPSGDTAAVSGEAGFEEPGSISVYSGKSGEVEAVRRVPGGLGGPTSLQLPTESEIGLYDAAYGNWEERRIADWGLLWRRSIGYGAREAGGVPSANGRWISATNGADTVPVWSTRGNGSREHPELTGEVPLSGFPTALAIDPDGQRLAIAESGVIYVAPLAPPGESRSAAIALRGGGAMDFGSMDLIRFSGDGKSLVSASNDRIAVWDFSQLDRLATVSRLPLGGSCTACNPPRLAVSPDGRQLAVALHGNSPVKPSALIQPLDDEKAAAQPFPVNSISYAPPVWLKAGAVVAFPIEDDFLSEGPPVVPEEARAWPIARSSEGVAVAARAPDDRSVVVVDDRGRIYVQDGETGDVISRLAAPRALSRGSDQLIDASVDSSGRLVARLYPGGLTISDLDSGEIVAQLPPNGATSVRYAGDRLLVQREGGTLEVWDGRGATRERLLPGDRSYSAAPTGSPDGALVARPHTNGEITLSDLRDGATLGVLQVPPEAGFVRTGIAFAPDALTLLTVTESYSEGGSYLVRRDLAASNLIQVACRAAGRALTGEEWDRLVGRERPEQLACETPEG
jgi:WD40 repeat protein